MTYHCTNKTAQKCGIRDITITSKKGNTQYLKLSAKAPYYPQYRRCVVYANGKNLLPPRNQDGTTWETAFSNLQRAMDAAAKKAKKNDPCEVWVTTGVYYPTIDPKKRSTPKDPREKTFIMRDWVAVYGGFFGNETEKHQRAKGAKSILDGDIGKKNDIRDNAFTVVTAKDVASSLNSLTIQNGNANTFEMYSREYRKSLASSWDKERQKWTKFHEKKESMHRYNDGGGIYVSGAQVMIRDTALSHNRAEFGAAIFTLNKSLVRIENTVIKNSIASEKYETVSHCSECSWEVVNSTIEDAKKYRIKITRNSVTHWIHGDSVLGKYLDEVHPDN